MIKKLLSIAFFALTAHAASAQCTPNPAYAGSEFGVWPDTTENLPIACPNNPNGYEAVINLKTLTDSILDVDGIGLVNAYIKAFKISDISGLPAGFVVSSNQAVWVNGGSSPNFTPVQGCVSILANSNSVQAVAPTSTSPAIFPITLSVDVQISGTDNSTVNGLIGGAVLTGLLTSQEPWLSELNSIIPTLDVLEVTGYKIIIYPSSDPECLNAGTAELVPPVSAKGNFPNPFNKNTNIQFNSDASKMVNISVANMVGKVVYTSKIQANKGENTVNFTAEQLSPGVYFYTISDGKNSVTRRMVVAAN